jgi:hypothetical protein
MMHARLQLGDEDALEDLEALSYQCIGLLMAGVDTSSSGFTNTLLALTQVGRPLGGPGRRGWGRDGTGNLALAPAWAPGP